MGWDEKGLGRHAAGGGVSTPNHDCINSINGYR